jgi:hypothetical protein
MIFVKSLNGKRIPCDPTPVPYILYKGQVVQNLVLAEDTHVFGYVSHFATCPYASAHRRPREKPGESKPTQTAVTTGSTLFGT